MEIGTASFAEHKLLIQSGVLWVVGCETTAKAIRPPCCFQEMCFRQIVQERRSCPSMKLIQYMNHFAKHSIGCVELQGLHALESTRFCKANILMVTMGLVQAVECFSPVIVCTKMNRKGLVSRCPPDQCLTCSSMYEP